MLGTNARRRDPEKRFRAELDEDGNIISLEQIRVIRVIPEVFIDTEQVALLVQDFFMEHPLLLLAALTIGPEIYAPR